MNPPSATHSHATTTTSSPLALALVHAVPVGGAGDDLGDAGAYELQHDYRLRQVRDPLARVEAQDVVVLAHVLGGLGPAPVSDQAALALQVLRRVVGGGGGLERGSMV